MIGALPDGATLRPLSTMPDERGALTELYRTEWVPGGPAVQWNFIRSDAGVMRGMRVHPRHDDYLVVLEGFLQIGLRDLRRGGATFGRASLVELRGSGLAVLTIPAGVAHGLYFAEASLVLIGVTRYHDPEDEIACRWDDPALEIPWPVASVRLSPSDASAPPLADMIARVNPAA
jgi:dTDP-4-dehydrorhamnose 3,5-epimerase